MILVLVGLMTLLIGGGMVAARAGVETPPSGWVAYNVDNFDWEQQGIYIARADGKVVQKVEDYELLRLQSFDDLQWSADGQWLFFVSHDANGRDIYRASLRDCFLRNPTNPAFDFDKETEGYRYLIPLNDRCVRNLTNSAFDENTMSLSPDGTQIAYVFSDSGQTRLARVPFDGGEIQQLFSTSRTIGKPIWSPNGEWLTFNLFDAPGVKTDIHLMRADGTGLRQLTSDVHNIRSILAWSPDGVWIYFSGQIKNGEKRGVFRVHRDRGEIEPVTNDEYYWQFERLSPDGQWVTATRSEGLYLMPVKGGEAQLLQLREGFRPDNQVASVNSAWSPDGKRIAFATCGTEICGVGLVSSDGREYQRLTRRFYAIITAPVPVWSPPIDTPFRGGVVLTAGAALVVAGIAPWRWVGRRRVSPV
jgi:Tol biopolymer transport system component